MKLEAVDITQCQAYRPTGYRFMPLGELSGDMCQCADFPAVIITVVTPDEDGGRSSMSLCADCLDVFNAQKGTQIVSVTIIRREWERG